MGPSESEWNPTALKFPSCPLSLAPDLGLLLQFHISNALAVHRIKTKVTPPPAQLPAAWTLSSSPRDQGFKHLSLSLFLFQSITDSCVCRFTHLVINILGPQQCSRHCAGGRAGTGQDRKVQALQLGPGRLGKGHCRRLSVSDAAGCSQERLV